MVAHDLRVAARVLDLLARTDWRMRDVARVLDKRPEVLGSARSASNFGKYWGREQPGDDVQFIAYAWVQTRNGFEPAVAFTWSVEIAWRNGEMAIDAGVLETHDAGQSLVLQIGDCTVRSIDELEARTSEFIEGLLAAAATFDLTRSHRSG